ncbi:MAG TPA: hypothetical protein ENJ10_09515 [Caldithrix abyssi]|uniref:histidine kinase n=1 Tax=Caldithrix abyssi TaxID=187145 RepID=A0A7V1LMS8_CALAY|nr:hypothetical protein [Caldithrix abyssi]
MSFNSFPVVEKGFVYKIALYNTLIALLPTLANLFLHGEKWLQSFMINLLFAHSIGWSIALPSHLFLKKSYRGWSRLKKGTALTLVLLVFGAMGSQLGYFLVHSVFFPGVDLIFSREQMFLINLALSVLFGLAGIIYFTMEEKIMHMAESLKEREMEQERLKALRKSAELEALRARTDPHFLFNTLNSIASLIRSDADKAERMTEQLAALFRYTLDSKNRERVSLREELEVIQSYLEIEKIRLGRRLQYHIETDEAALGAPVPPLLLQPLVENAVVHGLSPKRGGGEVQIRAACKQGRLHILIRDNGVGLGKSNTGTGNGLSLVRERLRHLYGAEAALDIRDARGVSILLELPLASGTLKKEVTT